MLMVLKANYTAICYIVKIFFLLFFKVYWNTKKNLKNFVRLQQKKKIIISIFIYFVRRFSTKQIKCWYLHELNTNPSWNTWIFWSLNNGNGISTIFCEKKWYFHCIKEKLLTEVRHHPFFPLWKWPLCTLFDTKNTAFEWIIVNYNNIFHFKKLDFVSMHRLLAKRKLLCVIYPKDYG